MPDRSPDPRNGGFNRSPPDDEKSLVSCGTILDGLPCVRRSATGLTATSTAIEVARCAGLKTVGQVSSFCRSHCQR